MRVLAIETATEACSIALFEDGALVAHDHRELGRGHAERLIPMIAGLPRKGQADRILVSLGPGSFTGVRIGIAAARALGFAWNAQVLGYPTLALIAAMAQRGDNSPVTVCMNGGHGEWFVQDFAAGAQPLTALASLAPEDARVRGAQGRVAGNRAAELAALLGPGIAADGFLPDARHVLALGTPALVRDLAPIYGRAPDAVPQTRRESP